MKKIGILFGMENTFPPALVERINAMEVEGVHAEALQVGGVKMAEPCGYDLIIDRISQDIPFYRSFLKNAVLSGTVVINNPFWWTADDKFFNYGLASRLGVAIPPTVLLPHFQHPAGTTEKSMRNLVYPLDWDGIFEYIGFPAYLKPCAGGGWRNIYKVNNRVEFFQAYHQTADLCMTLQRGVNFDDYYRCYVIGQEKVHVMRYDPRAPHAERYVRHCAPVAPELYDRIVRDCLSLCEALGYDVNAVEFACEGGVPYAIDFLNPAPDADVYSVGPENFEWMVEAMAQLAVQRVLAGARPGVEYRWSAFLNAEPGSRRAVG